MGALHPSCRNCDPSARNEAPPLRIDQADLDAMGVATAVQADASHGGGAKASPASSGASKSPATSEARTRSSSVDGCCADPCDRSEPPQKETKVERCRRLARERMARERRQQLELEEAQKLAEARERKLEELREQQLEEVRQEAERIAHERLAREERRQRERELQERSAAELERQRQRVQREAEERQQQEAKQQAQDEFLVQRFLAAHGFAHVNALKRVKASLLRTRSLGPLHLAVERGDGPVVEALVRQGADVGLKNGKGQVAYDLALKLQQEESHPTPLAHSAVHFLDPKRAWRGD